MLTGIFDSALSHRQIVAERLVDHRLLSRVKKRLIGCARGEAHRRLMTQIPMMSLMEEAARRCCQCGVSLIRAVSTREIPSIMGQVRTELALLDLVEGDFIVGHLLGATTVRNLVDLRLVNAFVEALEWTARSAGSSLKLLLRIVLQIIVGLLLQ